MSIVKQTVREFVKELIDETTRFKTVIVSSAEGTPLYYDFNEGINPTFKFTKDTLPDFVLDQMITINKPTTGYQLIPESCIVVTELKDLPFLQPLLASMIPDVDIPFCAGHSLMLTMLAVSGGLPHRVELKSAVCAFYALFDHQVVQLLERKLDRASVGLVDNGIYDFSGNRAVGQAPELYVPLVNAQGFAAWIIFEAQDQTFTYRFGVRTGPGTQLIEIKPEQFTPQGLEQVIEFVTGSAVVE